MFVNLPKVYRKCDDCGTRFEIIDPTFFSSFSSAPQNPVSIFDDDSTDETSAPTTSKADLFILDGDSIDDCPHTVKCPKCGSTHISQTDRTLLEHLSSFAKSFLGE